MCLDNRGSGAHDKVIGMLQAVCTSLYSCCRVSTKMEKKCLSFQIQCRLLEVGAHIATPRDKATPTKLGPRIIAEARVQGRRFESGEHGRGVLKIQV